LSFSQAEIFSMSNSMIGVLASCLLCGLVLAAADSDNKALKDAAAIQGTWQVVTHQVGAQPSGDPAQHRLVFEGQSFRLMEGEQQVAKGTFKLDPSKAPHTIDMEIAESGEPDSQGKTALGIYELKDDKLTWCSAQPGSDQRPTTFAAKGTQNLLATLKRAAAEKK
jgi:uncharacterized protein (TIGR03067 family)